MSVDRFDSTDNGNAAKKPNHYNNNNNNNHNHNHNNNNNNNDDNDNDNDNDVKVSNSIMGAVNPAVLEKWMMEERYGRTETVGNGFTRIRLNKKNPPRL